jgi:hypothetical protein
MSRCDAQHAVAMGAVSVTIIESYGGNDWGDNGPYWWVRFSLIIGKTEVHRMLTLRKGANPGPEFPQHALAIFRMCNEAFMNTNVFPNCMANYKYRHRDS